MGENVTEFILLENHTGGEGPIVEWTGVGPATLHLEGNWDGATVTITEKPKSGSSWVSPPTNFAFTKNTAISFKAGRVEIKAAISGEGVATSLSGWLVPSD